MKTANLAIVFTDIKGFTERTSQQTLEQNQRLLAIHAGLLTPLFRSFGGRIVKSIGDAFLVTFESPTQAVLSGIAIQDKLWYHNQAASPAERLDVRVAINAGEVRREGGDIFGEPVNIASRVEGIAEAGEVYFTEAVYLSMNKAEVPSEEVGVFELKGIPGKVRVYRVPKAPYRVEARSSTGSAPQPPFGNLGLDKAHENTGAGAVVATIGDKAVELGSALGSALAKRRRILVKRGAVAAGGAVVLGLVLWMATRGSEIDRAINAVTQAPEAERSSRVEAARKLIAAEEKAVGQYDTGRLQEAMGSHRTAITYYRLAAKDGEPRAATRLIELLGSEDCRVRAAAADTLGELKLGRARSGLEALADKGGADDNDIPIFGCNSRRAAQDALHRLE